jgi:uncharacterized repeat protein (TIGR02543 family)
MVINKKLTSMVVAAAMVITSLASIAQPVAQPVLSKSPTNVGNTIAVQEITANTAQAATVTIPGTAYSVNYALVSLTNPGNYTYKLNGATVTPSNVLADGSIVKIPVGAAGTASLTVTGNHNEVVISGASITFENAGNAVIDTVYAKTPMTFSEFYYDVTASEALQTATTFATDGTVTTPKKFINPGTRQGTVVGGVDTDTFAEAEAKIEAGELEYVDAISTATYGDAVHFAPDGNLTLVGDRNVNNDPTKAITGIKSVDISVDYDLIANASLLEAAGQATAQSTAVLEKLADEDLNVISLVSGTNILKSDGSALDKIGVYAAKPMLTDGNFGTRSVTDASAAKALPGLGNNGVKETVAYGGQWGEKTTGFSFGDATALTEAYAGAAYWDEFYNNAYGGIITDSDGHTEPLLPHLDLFSHRMHTDFDVAISPSRFVRFGNLNPNDTYTVVAYFNGFEDATFQFDVKNYINADAAMASTSIQVEDTTKNLTIKLSGIEEQSADYVQKATLTKDGQEVAFTFTPGPHDCCPILNLSKDLFAGNYWGTYTLRYETETTISKPLTFTLINAAPIATLVAKGSKISLSNSDFASTIVTTGRGGYSTISKDGTTPAAIGDAIAKDGDSSVYYINTASEQFVVGSTYKLVLVAPGFNNQTYVIKITEAEAVTPTAPAVTFATVTFNANGGSYVHAKTVQESNALGNVTTPTKNGYTFKGWFTAATKGTKVTAKTIVKSDVTYHAQWTANKVKVTYNGNSGKIDKASSVVKTISYNSTYASVTPTKTGYTFKGWYTTSAKTGGTKVDNKTVLKKTASHNLYARWSINKYKATFNANGGSKIKNATITKDYNSKLGKLPPVSKKGYKFAGFYTKEKGGTKITTSTKLTKNVTYYAHWTKKK